jgi:hypothetical protein
MEGQEAYPVSEGADRFGSPTFFLNGRFDCKVSGQETDGRLCIFDTVRTQRGGPPLHYHYDQRNGSSCAKASSSSRSASTSSDSKPATPFSVPEACLTPSLM